jgi:hypothetical protein
MSKGWVKEELKTSGAVDALPAQTLVAAIGPIAGRQSNGFVSESTST